MFDIEWYLRYCFFPMLLSYIIILFIFEGGF